MANSYKAVLILQLLSVSTWAATTSSPSTSESDQIYYTQGLPAPQSLSSTSSTRQPSRSNAPRFCNVTDVSCPKCDRAYIEGDSDNYYHVLCDNSLYSQRSYAVQESLSPGGCMKECDNYTRCEGFSTWEDGNCQLARGQNVFPTADRGHTAFLPADPYHTPSDALISAYPTGAFTSWPHSSTRMTTRSAPTTSCAHSSTSSHRSLHSTTRRWTSSTRRSITLPQASGTTRSTSLHITPSPTPTEAIFGVSCPSDDNFVVEDLTHGHNFVVQCDAGLGAGLRRALSAGGFAACAAHCTADCAGFELISSTSCSLLTSITIISSKPGHTVGVHISLPRSQ